MPQKFNPLSGQFNCTYDGSNVAGVTSVNGSSGAITIDKNTVSLNNVDNVKQVPYSSLGVAGGVATLDSSGKVPIAQVPAVNAEVKSVTNKAARLALATNTNNLMIALQADTQWMWAINKGLLPAVEANWIDCGSTAAAVVSVNGSTGAVTVNCATLGAVPIATKVNGKALSGDITLTLSDIVTAGSDTTKFLRNDLSWGVPAGGGGVAANYFEAYNTSTQSATSAGTIVTLSTAGSTTGSAVSLSGSCFLLKAGYTYKISGTIGYGTFSNVAGYVRYQWRIGQTGGSGTLIGAYGQIDANGNTSTSCPAITVAEAIYTPTSDTYVHLEIVQCAYLTSIGNVPFARAFIEAIAGSPTVTGQSVDYLEACRITSDQTLVTTNTDLIFNGGVIGNIPYNTTTGVATLSAGKTYELIGEPSFITFSDTTSGYVTYEWVDASTNNTLNTLGYYCGNAVANTVTAAQANSPIARVIYTPTTNQTVKLRIRGASGTATFRSATGSKITIKQLGTSSVIDMVGATSTTAGVKGTVPAPAIGKQSAVLRGDATWDNMAWTSYTPTITGSTTNPTLATTKTLLARYRQIGKSLQIAFTYFAASSTGAANGSGAYLFSLPSGFTIDTTVAPIVTTPTSVSNDFCGFSASTLGIGVAGVNVSETTCAVVGSSTTTVSLMSTQSTNSSVQNTLVGSGSFPIANTGCYYKFTAEIPIV